MLLESFIGIIFVSFSSVVGDGLVFNVNCDFLNVVLFTVDLFVFSFLTITGGCCCCGCFFFGFIAVDCSILGFFDWIGFVVGFGENGRFCGGERRTGSGGGGGGGGAGAVGSSSPSLSSPSPSSDNELLSLIF